MGTIPTIFMVLGGSFYIGWITGEFFGCSNLTKRIEKMLDEPKFQAARKHLQKVLDQY